MAQRPLQAAPGEGEPDEPELPEPPPVRPPQDVSVYVAPGMQTATFEELLAGAGIVTGVPEKFEEVMSRITGLQAQVDEMAASLQRQIDALREHLEGATPEPPEPPEPPETQAARTPQPPAPPPRPPPAPQPAPRGRRP